MLVCVTVIIRGDNETNAAFFYTGGTRK